MNLTDALAATTIDRGPSSRIERVLAALPGPQSEQVATALAGGLEAAALARAITHMARHLDIITDAEKDVTAEMVRRWRDAHGSR